MADSTPKEPPKHHVGRLASTARSLPLACAVVAPLITLLDIPALSQRWYVVDGMPHSDPTASVTMSAVSLAFCVLGNALLIVRFSSNIPSVSALVVEAPLVAFWIKTVVEIINLSIFGRHNVAADAVYGEGFWCAVFSCGLSGIVAVLLLWHFVVQRKEDLEDSIKIRVDGRHFILSVSSFVAVIALQALVFSRIEKWSYFDAVYFSIVTCLTVGYGNLTPTKTSTRIILFPFALVAIALLASQVSMIVGYFADHEKLRRNKYRAQRLMLAREGRSAKDATQWGLEEEMEFLDRMQKKERRSSQYFNLAISLSSFLIFWVLGAVVFKYAEGWTMGTTLYFVYISFLTIGFGDYSPNSSLGRVYFVLWSLVAVPVVASFAVQTITTLIETVGDARLAANKLARQDHMEHNKADEHEKEDEESFHPHADFILRNWQKIEQQEGGTEDSDAKKTEDQTELADRALNLACRLESLSRTLLISALPSGSKPQTLLKADRNVQRRDMEANGASSELHAMWEEEDEMVGGNEEHLLHSIKIYRQTFAELLVVGSQLRRLEGQNRQAFLRIQDRRDSASLDDSRAQREMQAMNNMDGPIEIEGSGGRQFQVDVRAQRNRKGQGV